jgi:Flp pilus assembly protein TadG
MPTVLRSRRGAAAVEFALVATPFIFALFAIIESGLIFVAQIDLSNATMFLARQIRTGAVMASGSSSTTSGTVLSLSDFKTQICSAMKFIPTATCSAQLQVDMRTQSAFGSGQTTVAPIVNLNFNAASLCYNSGQAGSIVEFRAYYLWTVDTPLLLGALVNATAYTVGGTTMYGNYHVITSAEAFRIEQNASGTNAGSGC